jgi:GTP-binding protein
MIVDEAKLHIRAGHGGPGKVCFSTIPHNLGPTGGNGGLGGSVFVEGVSDLSALRQYRFKKDFFAEDGVRGGEANCTGAAGDDLILKVPIGTVVHDLTTKKVFEVTRPGERVLIAKGGKGGKGNFEFRGPKNPTPEYAQPGLPGEEFEALFELQLIADAGLIGLPNAGKSSLLNAVTNARSKVGAFQFTTLEPSLGDFHGFILADIPGLIEGAAEGKGLGHKFLRHIKRTKFLIHAVSTENEDVLSAYDTVRKEITKYGGGVEEKKEIVILTKTDLATSEEVAQKIKDLKKRNPEVYTVSVIDDASLKEFQKVLSSFLA